MAIQFKVVPKTEPGVKGGGKRRYCAAPAYRGTLEFDEIASDISDQSTLSIPDTRAAISAFTEYIIKNASNGYSLQLEGLGTFSVSFKSEMKDTAQEVTAKCVKEVRLVFRPEVKLKNRLQKAHLTKKYTRKKK